MSLERVDKIISNMGYSSRKETAKLALKGKLIINGEVCKQSDVKVNPEVDEIYLNNEKIEYEKFSYILLNKQAGYITATQDKREKTVMDLLPERYKKMGLFPSGRLDKDTEGLLIITNDGDFSHHIMSPKNKIEKTYLAKISGKILNEEDVKAFRDGITFEDGTSFLPANLKILNDENVQNVEITLHEGKFHQVKRMIKSRGAEVIYLKRIKIGRIFLEETLKIGQFRPLTSEEIILFGYDRKK